MTKAGHPDERKTRRRRIVSRIRTNLKGPTPDQNQTPVNQPRTRIRAYKTGRIERMRIHTGVSSCEPLSDGYPPPVACRGATLGIEADSSSNVLLQHSDCVVSVLYCVELL